MAKIMAISNQKGGVGKTTTTYALGCGLKCRGYRVLLIDFDPQGNLTFCVGGDVRLNANIMDVLRGTVAIQHAIQHTAVADTVCSNILLSGAELEFESANREFLLKEILKPIADYYDYILIDTPPSLSILTINAFAAADSVIVPIHSDIFSLQGIAQLNETIISIRQRCNSSIKIEGILLTKFNKRSVFSKQVLETAELIAQTLGTHIFETQIRPNITISEAQASQMDIMQYAPKSTIAMDYLQFTDEIIGRRV
ncbi:MAG: AAA family ATPase [Oscillospiraceae bacterium]